MIEDWIKKLDAFLQFNERDILRNAGKVSAEIIQKTWSLGMCLLKHLDPSHFQNIILGVLAIFIPFAIVFLTDILNSKKEKRSEFEKMVLSDEVLGTKNVFWLAIIGMTFFAFFSEDTPSRAKMISIIVAAILICFLYKPFKRILRFSEGYTPEFEISFLKKLNFSKADKLLRAWGSFWSEKSEIPENEPEFTKIFIFHIDDAVNHEKFNLAVQLAQTYATNIENRNGVSIGYQILPKIFKWAKIFWKKRLDRDQTFWDWRYFGREFFQAIVKSILKDGGDTRQLFLSFKKHVDETEDEKEREEYFDYIPDLFNSFCQVFFNEINNVSSNYNIWKYDFPAEWKITIANKDNKIAHIVLCEFSRWAENRISKRERGDKDLKGVVEGIFPNVHPSLFPAFLMLFFSGGEVRHALEQEPDFYISDVIVSWGFVGESEKDRDRRFVTERKARAISQKEETVQIILRFFRHWPGLIISEDRLSKEEFANWKNYAEGQKQLIAKRVRGDKLKEIKTEIESDKIKEICQESKQKEQRREDFLELIELLIREIEK